MKPQAAPFVPGSTEFERFDNAMRKFLTVSKADIAKADEAWKRDKANTKKPQKPKSH